MGRNEVPPQKVQESSSVREYSPEIGWLIFRSQKGEGNILDVRSGGIRDGIGAWPIAAYSHYEEEGVNYIPGTLCIPPEKCGPLNVSNDQYL